MTNFEKIKNFDIHEMAKHLDEIAFDDTPWMTWFNDNYCGKCESVEVMIEGYHHPVSCAYCELNENKCRFFDHYLSCEEICEKWLQKEVNE